MKVVILAGGLGTRLSEETDAMPKPMIDIGGKPLLWHIMKIFSAQALSEFVVALGYKGEVIKRYFLLYPQLNSDLFLDLAQGTVGTRPHFQENWKVNLIDTGHDTMTGGRLKRLRTHLPETFMLTYGDGLSNVDLRQLIAFHRAHGKLATVTAVRQPQRFGLLDICEQGQVNRFTEKPLDTRDFINGGFFVLEPGVFNYIEGDATPWEREPLRRLAADGELMAYRHDGYWQCVDTLHELRLLREVWNSGKAPWKLWD